MDHPDTGASQRDERVVPRSHRLVRRLCVVYALAIVGVVLLLSAATLPRAL